MSEGFKVGDRVIARSRRDLGEGVIEAIEQRYVVRCASGATYTGWAESFELAPPEPPSLPPSLLEAAEALIELMEAAAGRTLCRPEVLAVKSALDREKAKQRELERSHMVDTKGRL